MGSLGFDRVGVVGHDIGLMVAYAYAAQFPEGTERLVLMDAFLPGIGNWKDVWLMRDLWHFHFHGEVPLALVKGRERTYFEHFWNDFAADPQHSVPEADRPDRPGAAGGGGREGRGHQGLRALAHGGSPRSGHSPARHVPRMIGGRKESRWRSDPSSAS